MNHHNGLYIDLDKVKWSFSGTSFPGIIHKYSIVIDGVEYMLKVSSDDSERLSLYSEMLCYLICRQIGIDTSEMWLTTYNGRLALLSKNWFDKASAQFFPLASYYEEKIDSIALATHGTYDLFKTILAEKCPAFYDEYLVTFWKVCVVDYFICNGRSAGNIGFIDDGVIRLSPIYDTTTRLKDISDESYKDPCFPRIHMKFLDENNSGLYVLTELKDSHKETAMKEIQERIDFNTLTNYITTQEERYLLDVISYRFNILYK